MTASDKEGGASHAHPPTPHDETRSLLTTPFVLILLSTALYGMAFSAYFLFPKYMATVFAADPATIGGLNAVSMFMSVVFMPIVGGAVDRHGRRRFATLGAVVFCLACLGFLAVEEVGPLMWVLRSMQGLAFTLFFISLSTLATDLAPPRRMGQAIGLFGGVMISTNALGPAFAEWTALHHGWTMVFAGTAVSSALAALLTTCIAERPHPQVDEAPTSMWAIVTRPGLRRVLLVASLAGCAMGTVFTFYQPWALDRGITHVSTFLVGFAGCAMFVRFGLGGLADRLGRQRVATVSLFFYVAAPMSLIWVDTVGLLVAGCLLGLSHGLFFPALNAVALDHAGLRERGKAMAAYHGGFNIGFAGGSYVLGFVAAAYGYPAIFTVAGVGCVLAFAVLATAPRARHTH
ncbi:MAG: MFS transporter [Gammaproteobacteria bacterium]|nr:MFS transporter [Gammaproteobacteria bacterium]